jgi:malic enzyme
MKISAAFALAECVKDPSVDNILPSALDKDVPRAIADAVKKTWKIEKDLYSL